MLAIGVVTRGKYGHRLIDTIRKYTDFKVISGSIPWELPSFIDDAASFVDKLEFDRDVLSTDLIILYCLHPDITPEIVLRAAKAGARAAIIPGGRSIAGDPYKLQEISDQFKIKILVEDICCELGGDADPFINEFAELLGLPELQIDLRDDIITKVKVIRGAPCGSTWNMAEQLKGTPFQDAPAKAGLLIQQYPCRAVRGIEGGIHRSAGLHKKAVEAAIKKYLEAVN